MILVSRRSAATLLAISTRRNFILSSSTLASLAIVATPFSSSAFPAPSLSTQQSSRKYKTSSSSLAESSCTNTMTDPGTGYLNAQDAAALDAELMSTPGFSLEQLMELAGLSVAEAVYDVAMDDGDKKKHALLVCGPGNNGGDGLVAARHLVHFGLDATIVYPKRSSKTHFVNLVKQCEDMGIPILDEIPMDTKEGYDVIVDAIFGFSFHGTAPREPYATAITNMVQLQKQKKSLLLSVDVPSGWDVDGGDLTGTNFHPDVLVSLTAPKLSAKKFRGRHFVGGRFLPPAIAEKYGIRMPPYPGLRHSMEVYSSIGEEKDAHEKEDDPDDWANQYQAYLDEQESLDNEDAINQKDIITLDEDEELEGEDWAIEYAKYCEEKEREFFESNKTNEA
ncbi:hypothetical protein ACHAXR_009788 [Thalassiosira sp. AJA248-18]